jgi:Sulfotransferase family
VSEARTQPGHTAEAPGARSEPSFLIVGTSRSGTTLVQRLAWRLEGVRVPPETHFFGAFVLGLAERAFPLSAVGIREEVARFAKMRTSRGLPLHPEAIVEDLGGACASPWDLFGAIVRDLAGPAATYGEKTPEHLRCWKALTRRAPHLRFVCVVREPRAVVASNLQVPFAPHSVPWLAERWRTDQGMVLAARNALGPQRFLTLRYEDVVADPDAALAEMSTFLDVPVGPADAATDTDPQLHMEWEWWKERAGAPITTDRVEAWRSTLTPRQADLVPAICRRTMRRFDYPATVGAVAAVGRSLTIAPRDQGRRLHFRAKILRYRMRMDRIAL